MKLLKPLMLILVGAILMLTGATYFASPTYLISPSQTEIKQVLKQTPPYFEELIIESKTGGKHIFKIEIADTTKTRKTGLMFREHMDQDRGMLFKLGQTEIVSLWMKNTLIPLDMVFIAPNGTIRKIHKNAEPKSLKSISSEVPVSAVLELNGGRTKALDIAVGDKVIHPYFVE